MSNWKNIIRKEEEDYSDEEQEMIDIEYTDGDYDLDPQSRAKLMDVYRNLNFELKEAAKELQKHGHDIRNSEGYVKLMIKIQEEWEQLRDSGEFGFGNRGSEIDE